MARWSNEINHLDRGFYIGGKRMFKIYGSTMCPDCEACKQNFDRYGVEYEFLDITASLKNLKEFLILRDQEAVFNHLKAIHDIGLPALVREDGSVFTDWESYLQEMGKEVIWENTGHACSLDHRGC